MAAIYSHNVLIDIKLILLTWCCSWTWGSSGGSWCSYGVQDLHSRSRCIQSHRGLQENTRYQQRKKTMNVRFYSLINLGPYYLNRIIDYIILHIFKYPYSFLWQYNLTSLWPDIKNTASIDSCYFVMLLLWRHCLCTDLSRTDVLLCELLLGGPHHLCGAGLVAAQRVRVHRCAVQHQGPLLQLAWGNRIFVRVSDTDPL